MRARAVGAIPLAAIALVVCGSGAAAQDSAVGWRISTRMARGTGASTETSVVVTHQVFTDRMIRFETEREGGPAITRGSYMLLPAHDSTLTVVSPARRTAIVSTMPALPFSVKVLSRSLKSTLTDLGPGDTLLGHATRRYRRELRGSVVESIGGHVCTIPVDRVTEYWIAPDLNVKTVMSAVLARLNPSAADAIAAAARGVHDTLPAGTALREISRDRLPDGPDRTGVETRVFEFTQLTHGPIADSLFQIPAGYSRIDLRGVAHARSSPRVDSTMIRASAARVATRLCARP